MKVPERLKLKNPFPDRIGETSRSSSIKCVSSIIGNAAVSKTVFVQTIEVQILHLQQLDLWCNGSTTVFGTVC